MFSFAEKMMRRSPQCQSPEAMAMITAGWN